MSFKNFGFRFTIATAGVLAIGVAFGVAVSMHALTPRAVVNLNPINLNELHVYEKRVVAFTLRNDGNQVLIVEPYGSPCCGCFLTEQAIGIRPNSEGAISVCFVVRDIPGRKDFKIAYTVRTNDPKCKELVLAVVGTVIDSQQVAAER